MQNMMYEDDYKKEREEKERYERRLTAAKDEVRNLQAIIDAIVSTYIITQEHLAVHASITTKLACISWALVPVVGRSLCTV